jgi:HD-like signal output (HDOD) protein
MSNAVAAADTPPGSPAIAGEPRVFPAGGSALDFLKYLAAELSGGSVDLPCFPDVIMRIHNTLMDPLTAPERAARIVGTEPRLAARLIQTANSATFNAAGNPVTDLRAAITRLGHQMVQSIAMTCALQQMKNAPALASIAVSLTALWRESIAVAAICQVVARRTKVGPDEAFLTGLMHGIGRLYIMVRATSQSRDPGEAALLEQIDGWHPSIGKAVLENWGFPEKMSDAVGSQSDWERAVRGEADLTDVLIAGIVLSATLAEPAPRTISVAGINAFARIGLTADDGIAILTHAEHQLGSLYDALGF